MKFPDQAIKQLRFLLTEGYELKQALHLIGNHYQLSVKHRKCLERGVCSVLKAKIRQRKKKGLLRLCGSKIGIDGHNVLITVESALKGGPLILADDGFIRDIAAVSSSYRPSSLTDKALVLILNVLTLYHPTSLNWYFDAPLAFSGNLAAMVRERLKEYGLTGDAQAVPVPEHYLIHYELIATSDRALIDKCVEVVDLAGEVIKFLNIPISFFNFRERDHINKNFL
ncbi:MAG TPA: DUF434 domain-containing protein, partial [Candidatus Desulfofervidus auxilii]|nr:DUF434 domain-containing protein [Candidatus Desulfofervidus auxilii]